MNLLQTLSQPWPWYIGGPLIGLIVPLLLIAGNKSFGISSSLRHICAACIPAKIPFSKYDWKKEMWNLFYAGGIIVGGLIAAFWLPNPAPVDIHPNLVAELGTYGISQSSSLLPESIFNWTSLLTFKGFVMMVVGGFFVGFGSRYGEGCTSGHAITGLSHLSLPSFITVVGFFIGGLFMTWFVLPYLLPLIL